MWDNSFNDYKIVTWNVLYVQSHLKLEEADISTSYSTKSIKKHLKALQNNQSNSNRDTSHNLRMPNSLITPDTNECGHHNRRMKQQNETERCRCKNNMVTTKEGYCQ